MNRGGRKVCKGHVRAFIDKPKGRLCVGVVIINYNCFAIKKLQISAEFPALIRTIVDSIRAERLIPRRCLNLTCGVVSFLSFPIHIFLMPLSVYPCLDISKNVYF